MTLKLALHCDEPGCEERLATKFVDSPLLQQALIGAATDRKWRVAPFQQQHFCPKHASPWDAKGDPE